MSFEYFLINFVLFLALVAEAHRPYSIDADKLATHTEITKRCGANAGFQKRTHRALRRRELSIDVNNDETTYEVHAKAPKHDFIKDWTNILTPEVTNGPYFYPRSQTLRQDIREGEPGVPLSLEIGVIDTNTCAPMKGVLVDIWHCNATGSYSSFTGLSPNTPFQQIFANITNNTSIDPTKGIPDLSWLSTDNTTFLRGMWPTNKHGVTSFTTIFPGFYVERAIHIHVQVHTNWTVASNGTITHGPIVSTGQIFIDETLEKYIMAMEPYAGHTQIDRFRNDMDGIYATESLSGAMTLLDTEPLDGVDYRNGVIGYITLGIDPSSIKNGSSKNPIPNVDLPTATH